MMRGSPEPEKLWKNQRVIDEFGLVECEPRERLFDNMEAATLFESLLKIYQEKGLGVHYLYLHHEDQTRKFETVEYRAYVRFRCINREFDGGRKVIAPFLLQYELLRIPPALAHHFRFPVLLLFRPYCGERHCEECGDSHHYKIFESSLYVIRSQFISMVQHKVFFMQRYPAYNFEPCDFVEKRNSGDVVYEYIRDHNYEPSYYFEKSEEVLCNAIRLQTLLRGMDFQTVRFDVFKTYASEKEVQMCEKLFERRRTSFKLKYMCRKCNPKQIWTTKNDCIEKIAILKLTELPSGEGKVSYDKCGVQLKDIQQKYCGQRPLESGQALAEIFNIKDIKLFTRRLDRSQKQEVEDYEDYGEKLNCVSRWHERAEEYRCPLVVVLALEVPKMKCQQCLVDKDGLVYITNLLEQLHAHLVLRVMERVKKAIEEMEKPKDAKEKEK